jgi:hypothetical protein
MELTFNITSSGVGAFGTAERSASLSVLSILTSQQPELFSCDGQQGCRAALLQQQDVRVTPSRLHV